MASFLPTLSPADLQRAAQVSKRQFSSIIVAHRHIKQSLFRNPIIRHLHTACRRMNIVVSRASCTSCNADGKPGASLSPSYLTTLTRTFNSSGRIRPRSKSRETGTRQIHSQYTLIPYVCFRESFPTAHSDELVPFLLNITGRSISFSLGKVILRKLFIAVCYLFFVPNVIHLLCSAICTRSEACAPRALSLAQLDHGDIHGAF